MTLRVTQPVVVSGAHRRGQGTAAGQARATGSDR